MFFTHSVLVIVGPSLVLILYTYIYICILYTIYLIFGTTFILAFLLHVKEKHLNSLHFLVIPPSPFNILYLFLAAILILKLRVSYIYRIFQ